MLASFAIPKGLPEAPKENRLAVRTEDHPLEYLDFEGEIPKGEYGAGTDEDLGSRHLRHPEVGVAQDRGLAARRAPRRALRAVSDRQGRGPEELDDPPHGPALPTRTASRCPRTSSRCSPARESCLADERDWAFEIKWDGVRAIAYSRPGELRLESRNLKDITDSYPELARLNRALSSHAAMLDGEIVAFDAEGRPSFGALQPRMHVGSRAQAKRLAESTPVTYVIFDLLWLDGHSLMGLPYTERRERLATLELHGEGWQTPEHLIGEGTALLEVTRGAGPRGDRREAPELDLPAGRPHAGLDQGQERRSPGVRDRRLDAGQGQATGQHRGAGCSASTSPTASCATWDVSAPASASGSSSALARCSRRCGARARRSTPASNRRARRCSSSRGSWPRSSSAEWTRAGNLRQPSYKGLREDKRARGGRARGTPDPAASESEARRGARAAAGAATEARQVGGRHCRRPRAEALEPRQGPVSATGFTKRDVIEYYAAIAPAMLSHLQGRALTVTRWPDGVRGEVLLPEADARTRARTGCAR